jgi:hypothetical protein
MICPCSSATTSVVRGSSPTSPTQREEPSLGIGVKLIQRSVELLLSQAMLPEHRKTASWSATFAGRVIMLASLLRFGSVE